MDQMTPNPMHKPEPEPKGPSEVAAKLQQAKALIDEDLAEMGEDVAKPEGMGVEEAFGAGFGQG